MPPIGLLVQVQSEEISFSSSLFCSIFALMVPRF